MKAIINEPNIFKVYAGEVFEIVEEKKDSYVLESIFSDTKTNIQKGFLAKEKNNKIEIFESPYSRNPEDNYLSLKLIYLTNKQEFATYVYNKETGGLSGGHYFIPKKITKKEMEKAFNEAFSDFLSR